MKKSKEKLKEFITVDEIPLKAGRTICIIVIEQNCVENLLVLINVWKGAAVRGG